MSERLIDGVDYGPLAVLAGTWQGDKGMDVAPEPDGPEHSPYYETILFEPIGELDNANQQELVALRYHQVVRRKANDKEFHNESGYWSWDAERNLIVQSFSIPRGVSIVAGGRVDEEGCIQVKAAADDADWGICQAPFMRDNAKTLAFEHRIAVKNGQ